MQKIEQRQPRASTPNRPESKPTQYLRATTIYGRYNQQCTQFPASSDMATTLQPASSTGPSPATTAGLSALLTASAIAPLDDTGWIRVTGEDRVRWLNGMVTNSIATLAPGQGCYNFVLNAQGRIQGDLTAWMLGDSILLETDHEQIPALLAHFNHFIIMDDVDLELMETRAGLLVAGTGAEAILQKLGISVSPPQLHVETVHWHGEDFPLIHGHGPLVPRWELWVGKGFIPKLHEAIVAAGATPVSSHALEALRILEGTPRYGTDIRNTESAKDLPQETAQARALHFAKGCYLGQEIVERIRSRGNVHRTFSGFTLTGNLPAAGIALLAESKPVGELTSVASIQLPSGSVQLALGYIRREALDRNLPLDYSGGTATPTTLPYPVF
jgi:folate-binding protein YgfZ